MFFTNINRIERNYIVFESQNFIFTSSTLYSEVCSYVKMEKLEFLCGI